MCAMTCVAVVGYAFYGKQYRKKPNRILSLFDSVLTYHAVTRKRKLMFIQVFSGGYSPKLGKKFQNYKSTLIYHHLRFMLFLQNIAAVVDPGDHECNVLCYFGAANCVLDAMDGIRKRNYKHR